MNIGTLMARPEIGTAFAWIDAHADDIVAEAIRICEIPAPTFDEGERAAYVRSRFEALGLADVTIDAAGNARARRPGAGGGPGVAVAAHVDTVFPRETDVTVRREGGRLLAPGIGDNSVSVAAMLGVLGALNAAGVRTDGDLFVAGNTGEEGLGNSRGMWAFLTDVRDRVGSAVAVEGMEVERIVHVAVGSRRYEATFTARGGHSWQDFPSPSAVHIMGRAISGIADLAVPDEPRTTFNVGVASGGTTVNTIAARARMLIDMRSVDAGALAEIERRVLEVVRASAAAGHGAVALTLVGDRPAGAIPADHPVVQQCMAIHRALGIGVYTEAASTDHNVPLAMGIPGVCLTIAEGANEHRLDEYLEIAMVPLSVKKLLLAVVALAAPQPAAA